MTTAKSTSKDRATVTSARLMSARKATATVPVPLAPAKSSSKVVAKAAPAIESARNAVVDSHRPKAKLVRDSFTIPKSEYSVLEGLKVRAANLTRPVKKSELLRAGIAVLSAMSDKAFLAALDGVPSLKTGRPKGPDTISAPAKGPK